MEEGLQRDRGVDAIPLPRYKVGLVKKGVRNRFLPLLLGSLSLRKGS